MSKSHFRGPAVQQSHAIGGISNTSLSNNNRGPVKTATQKRAPKPGTGNGQQGGASVAGDERGGPLKEAGKPQIKPSVTAPVVLPALAKIPARHLGTTQQTTIPLPSLSFLKPSKRQRKAMTIDRLVYSQKKSVLKHLARILGVKKRDLTPQQREVAFRVAFTTLDSKIKILKFDAMFNRQQRQSVISLINLTLAQSAETITRTANSLGKNCDKLSPADRDTAIKQKKIEMVMSVLSTGSISNDVESAIKEQNRVRDGEHDRILKRAAVSLGKPIGQLTQGEKEGALRDEEADIRARIAGTYLIPVQFPGKVNLNRIPQQQQSGNSKKKGQAVKLSAAKRMEALSEYAWLLRKPVNRLTQGQRKRALAVKRYEISRASKFKSKKQSSKPPIRAHILAPMHERNQVSSTRRHPRCPTSHLHLRGVCRARRTGPYNLY
ncbi:hypothetical protein FRC02_008362 [Tulasnella sp. 418]|nr:hypothetical protein FRC02_008362 [Tulasnella sp. 418]